jgi:hypothetical protein
MPTPRAHQINPKDLPMTMTRCVLLFCISLMLLACKPNYSATKAANQIETTLSSDGKLLAVLLDRREESPTLLIKWLDRDEPWLKVPAPKYTNSIRFGLSGYGLLLTHAQPGPPGASQLSRWDASRPDQPSEILYQGSHVAYPVEVRPGQYLVNLCDSAPEDDRCVGSGFVGFKWALIRNGEALPMKETSPRRLYRQPNVTEGGFYWMYGAMETSATATEPSIHSFALPGGTEPTPDSGRFDKSSWDIACDYKNQRCLIRYQTDDPTDRSKYVWHIRIFDGTNRCGPTDLKGDVGTVNVTPDGRAAVIPLALASDEPRHVVVLRFKPGQCEPTSIQRYDFTREVDK